MIDSSSTAGLAGAVGAAAAAACALAAAASAAACAFWALVYGILEGLDVGHRISRQAPRPRTLVEAVRKSCRCRKPEEVRAVERHRSVGRTHQHALELDVEIEGPRNAELVEKTRGHGKSLTRARQVVGLALVGEVRGHVSETGERHGIIGTILTVSADPVREVDHGVGVCEQVGPGHLPSHGIEVVEPPALQLGAHAHDRMDPFRDRKVPLESEAILPGSEVVPVREGRAAARPERDLPVVPEAVGHEPRETGLFRHILSRYGRAGKDQGAENKSKFFHSTMIMNE